MMQFSFSRFLGFLLLAMVFMSNFTEAIEDSQLSGKGARVFDFPRHFMIRGPTGPTGPMGATGKTGPQGVIGPKGEQGQIGPVGAQGSMGMPGERGSTGPQGLRGEVGATGPMGVSGSLFGYYIYSTSSFTGSLSANEKITFNSPQYSRGISYDVNNKQFLISSSGVYAIKILFFTSHSIYSDGISGADDISLVISNDVLSQEFSVISGVPFTLNYYIEAGYNVFLRVPSDVSSLNFLSGSNGISANCEIFQLSVSTS